MKTKTSAAKTNGAKTNGAKTNGARTNGARASVPPPPFSFPEVPDVAGTLTVDMLEGYLWSAADILRGSIAFCSQVCLESDAQVDKKIATLYTSLAQLSLGPIE